MAQACTVSRVEFHLPEPVRKVVDKSLATIFEKNLTEVIGATNKAIEAGVNTPTTAREAEAIVKDGRQVEKVVNGIRLEFTRPVDAKKKELMEAVKEMLAPLVEAREKLDGLLLAKAEAERQEKLRIAREYAERVAAAEEAARKREEHNRNISLGKGGTGEVAPVEPEQIAKPLATTGMRQTTRIKRIIDNDAIKRAVEAGARKIEGVKIYQVWTFEVEDASKVPDEYRRTIRG